MNPYCTAREHPLNQRTGGARIEDRLFVFATEMAVPPNNRVNQERKMKRRRCSEEKWQLQWFRDSQTQMAQVSEHETFARSVGQARAVDPNHPHLENAEQAKPRKAIQDFK